MAYAEFLRVRRSLAWHAGILAALTLLAIYFAHDTQFTINGTTHMASGMPLSLSMLVPFGMFFAMIYASSVGTSLNRESGTRDISWTKPISRTMLAFQFVALDLVAVALVFVLAMLAVTAVLLRIHITPALGGTFGAEALLGIGIAAMWYALIQVLSFWFGGAARSIGGILWPVALLFLAVSQAPGTLGVLARALDYVNPLAYASGISSGGDAQHTQAIALPAEARALCVWLLAAVFCAVAIALWPKKEA